MRDEDKTKDQLIAELNALRRRLRKIEPSGEERSRPKSPVERSNLPSNRDGAERSTIITNNDFQDFRSAIAQNPLFKLMLSKSKTGGEENSWLLEALEEGCPVKAVTGNEWLFDPSIHHDQSVSGKGKEPSRNVPVAEPEPEPELEREESLYSRAIDEEGLDRYRVGDAGNELTATRSSDEDDGDLSIKKQTGLEPGRRRQLDRKEIDRRILVLEQELATMRETEDQLRTALFGKELLLKEIHHRVKNNLQVVSDLITLESFDLEDPSLKRILQDCQSRIRLIAQIHEELCRSKAGSSINFAHLAENIGQNLLAMYTPKTPSPERDIDIRIEVDDILLPTETSIPCGLIINELLSNALKHAFLPGTSGEVHITLHRETPDRVVLTVSDNGTGLPEDFDITAAQSFGLKLVGLLTTQLEGTIELDRRGGTTFTITFRPSR